MPTYDYVCDACAHRFEHFQGISEPHLLACPSCRKRKLRRLIGAGIGVVFKGSGFYETDYKRAASAKQAAPATGGTTAGNDTAAPDLPTPPAGKPTDSAASEQKKPAVDPTKDASTKSARPDGSETRTTKADAKDRSPAGEGSSGSADGAGRKPASKDGRGKST